MDDASKLRAPMLRWSHHVRRPPYYKATASPAILIAVLQLNEDKNEPNPTGSEQVVHTETVIR